jgi:hypothetical protein
MQLIKEIKGEFDVTQEEPKWRSLCCVND